MQAFNFQPVIIIGAGRSGTNMVPDLLTAFPACATWPCDEINYIWRYGNAGFPTDELTAEHARPSVVRILSGDSLRDVPHELAPDGSLKRLVPIRYESTSYEKWCRRRSISTWYVTAGMLPRQRRSVRAAHWTCRTC